MKTIVTRRALLSLVDYGWKEVEHFSEVDGFYVMNHWPLVPGYATILVYDDGRVVSILAGEDDGRGSLFSLVISMDFKNMSIHPIYHTKDEVKKVRFGDAKVIEIMSNIVNYTAWYLGYKQAGDLMKLCFPPEELAMLAIGAQPTIKHPELN